MVQLDKMNEELQAPKGKDEVNDHIRDMLWQFESSFYKK